MFEGIAKLLAGIAAVTVAPFAQVIDSTITPPAETLPASRETASPDIQGTVNPFQMPAPENLMPPPGGNIKAPDGSAGIPPRGEYQGSPELMKDNFEGGQQPGGPYGGNPGTQGYNPGMMQGQGQKFGGQGGQNMMGGRMSVSQDEYSAKRLEKLLTQLKAKNITIPADAAAKLEAYRAAINTMKSAEGESAEDARLDLQETREGIVDLEPSLRMLGQWPTMQKQAERSISMIKKQLAGARKRALTAKVDVSKFVSKVEESITAMEKQVSDAKAAIAAGTIEEGFELVRDIHPDEEMTYNIGMIEAASQMSKMSGKITSHIKTLETKVARLAKQKDPETGERYDVSHLKELITEMKALAANVKTKIDAGAEPDEVMAIAEEGMGLYEEFMMEMSELTGEEYFGNNPEMGPAGMDGKPGMRGPQGGFRREPGSYGPGMEGNYNPAGMMQGQGL